jgi:hypothetical protein
MDRSHPIAVDGALKSSRQLAATDQLCRSAASARRVISASRSPRTFDTGGIAVNHAVAGARNATRPAIADEGADDARNGPQSGRRHARFMLPKHITDRARLPLARDVVEAALRPTPLHQAHAAAQVTDQTTLRRAKTSPLRPTSKAKSPVEADIEAAKRHGRGVAA